MSNSCVVLGATGFIGSHLCLRLLKEGMKIKLLVRDFNLMLQDSIVSDESKKYFISSDIIENDFNNIFFDNKNFLDFISKNGSEMNNTNSNIWNLKIYQGSFLDKKALDQIIEEGDYVFHLISTTIPGNSNIDPSYDLQSNLLPSIHLLEVCREKTVGKIIFFSSGGTVYGIPQYLPIDEKHPTNPISSYGIQKLSIEKYLQMYGYLYDIKFAILRISNPFGEWQNPDKGQGLISTCMYKILIRENLEVWGDGESIRDYIDINDVISASLLAMQSKTDLIINIASGFGTSINKIINTISIVLNTSPKILYKKARSFDVSANYLNITKANTELKWKPEIELEEGIQRLANYLITKVNN